MCVPKHFVIGFGVGHHIKDGNSGNHALHVEISANHSCFFIVSFHISLCVANYTVEIIFL